MFVHPSSCSDKSYWHLHSLFQMSLSNYTPSFPACLVQVEFSHLHFMANHSVVVVFLFQLKNRHINPSQNLLVWLKR